MKRPFSIRNSVTILGTLLVMLVFARCHSDYEISLRNGYLIARTGVSSVVVVNSSNRVIAGPNLTEYEVIDNYLVGRVQHSNGREDYVFIDMRRTL
jgi:hypothetical protein